MCCGIPFELTKIPGRPELDQPDVMSDHPLSSALPDVKEGAAPDPAPTGDPGC